MGWRISDQIIHSAAKLFPWFVTFSGINLLFLGTELGKPWAFLTIEFTLDIPLRSLISLV